MPDENKSLTLSQVVATTTERTDQKNPLILDLLTYETRTTSQLDALLNICHELRVATIRLDAKTISTDKWWDASGRQPPTTSNNR
jgi:hypothetical protein